jgi:hypothetical protein
VIITSIVCLCEKAGWSGSNTKVIVDAAYRCPNILFMSEHYREPTPAYAWSPLKDRALSAATVYCTGR